jgi:hypothetical protein
VTALERDALLARNRVDQLEGQGFSDPTTHMAKNWEPPP